MGLISNGTGADRLQSGTVAQRPTGLGTADVGYTRFNTDTNNLEQWTGTDWTVAFDIQDGSLTNNLITWRNEGQVDSWTTSDAGPDVGTASGTYSSRPTTGGGGTGLTVSVDYTQTALSNFVVNNGGSGYTNNSTITVDLDGTNTVSGTITVLNAGEEEGWAAKPGSDYFVSASVDDVYTGRPQFREGVIMGAGTKDLPSPPYTTNTLSGASLVSMPRGAKVRNMNHYYGAKAVEMVGSFTDPTASYRLFACTLQSDLTNANYVSLLMGYSGQTSSDAGDGTSFFEVRTRASANGNESTNINITGGEVEFNASATGGGELAGIKLATDGFYGDAIAAYTQTNTTRGLRMNAANKLQLITSSRRYKNNIRDCSVFGSGSALELVSQVQPRMWEDIDTGETVCGFIAEELFELGGTHLVSYAPWSETKEFVIGQDEEGENITETRVVYPRIGNGSTPVTKDGGPLTDDSEVVDGMNDKALVIALVQAVQELKAQNDALTARLDAAGLA